MLYRRATSFKPTKTYRCAILQEKKTDEKNQTTKLYSKLDFQRPIATSEVFILRVKKLFYRTYTRPRVTKLVDHAYVSLEACLTDLLAYGLDVDNVTYEKVTTIGYDW